MPIQESKDPELLKPVFRLQAWESQGLSTFYPPTCSGRSGFGCCRIVADITRYVEACSFHALPSRLSESLKELKDLFRTVGTVQHAARAR